jgi:hypothetical protein
MNRFQSFTATAALAAVLATGLATGVSAPAAFAAEPGYKALEFTQYSGQSGFEFAIPQDDVPVRIDIAARIDDKPVGGSMVFSALVTRDRYSGAISWVGTDSDGNVKAGNTTAGDRVLARLSGPDGENYAVLRIAGGKKLKVVQQAGASGSKGTYFVRIWY